MELRHLRYFIAVAEEGSLTLAAEKRLRTAQPSLSRQMRALENEVGVLLITRSVHGIELTPAGRAFLDHARLSVTQAEAAKEAARHAAQPAKASLALGFLSGTEMGLLPRAMRILQDELPSIEVKLTSDYSPRLADALTKRTLDAAFMRPEPHDGSLVYKRVRTEPLILVFPRGHRLAARKGVRLSDIKGEPFIKPSKTAPTLRKIIEESLRRSGLDLRAIHEVHNLAHAFSMIASTRAVTMLPAYAKNYLPSSVTSRPIKGEAPTVDLVVGYNKSNSSDILKRFLRGVDDLISHAFGKGHPNQKKPNEVL
jgi:LysR family transcriptional regulator, hca operon transcriptional activator